MVERTWLSLTSREQAILQEALRAYAGPKRPEGRELTALSKKLRRSRLRPQITIGVQGGMVQWTSGNPFPIRICDYDGDGRELPDVDAQDQRCEISFAPPDTVRRTGRCPTSGIR